MKVRWLLLILTGCNLTWDNPGTREDDTVQIDGGSTVDVSADASTPVMSSGTFGVLSSYAADVDPMDLAIGDFNNDGRPDLAVANNKNQGSNVNTIGTVSVLLGNANGTFQNAVNYTAGYGPVGLVTGDFNRDGKLDLVTTNLAQGMGGNGTILLGVGNGTFGGATAFAACCSPQGVAVGDVNNDEKLDLVIANYFSVQVLLGNGTGGFGAPLVSSLGGVPYSIAVGDLNNDGKLDVVTDYNFNNEPQRVAVLVGNGDGTLQAAVLYGTGSGSGSVVQRILIADLDHDSKRDVVTDNGVTNDISVLRGTGTGALLAPTAYAMGMLTTGGVIGDFNGDTVPDVAVAAIDAATVVVRLGNGGATFGASTAYMTQGGPRAVGSADFNGDGRADLAVVAAGAGAVDILLGQP